MCLQKIDVICDFLYGGFVDPDDLDYVLTWIQQK